MKVMELILDDGKSGINWAVLLA